MSGPRRREDERQRFPADPKPAQPPPRRQYPADSLKPPPPPERPKQDGPRRWDMNKKAPADWQREKPAGRSAQLSAPKPRDRRTSYDDIDGRAQSASERDGMMRGAYFAGKNGDKGAAGSFPNTPEGRRMRAEYQRGLADRQREERKKRPGLGFAGR